MSREKWAHAFETKEDRRTKKRMAVLRVGASLFNERGFDRTTLDDIAEALNVTKRTLYYYIDSKEEILHECNLRGAEIMRDIVDLTHDQGLPPLERIEALLRRYVTFLADDMGICVVLSISQPLAGFDTDELRTQRGKVDRTMRALIQEGIRDGSIRPCDPRLTTAAIFGSFNWVPHWNRGRNQVPLEQIAESYIALAINGLKAR